MEAAAGVVRLELENFKSYRGTVTIGPFADFTAVVGPNGSGKSNVMDAISFVLGVRAAHLRGASLKDLIYSVEGEKTDRRASVTLLYRARDGRETQFKRLVRADGSGEYRIDDVGKTWEEYDEVLRSIHILTKARNFLVFQGDVENVAQKSPKDLTALLEMVSGSDEFKEEYEAKRRRKEETTARMLDASSKRRGVGAEKHQYRLQKKEAERFRELRAEQTNAKRDFALFQLFYIETELTAMRRELQRARRELKELQAGNQEGGREYEQCKKDFADLHKKSLALIKTKQDRSARQSQLQRQADKLVLQVRFTEDKLAEAQSQVKKVREAGKQHTKDVQALQRQLDDVKAEQAAWEKKRDAEIKALEGQALTESQYQEWRTLKQTATTKTITVAQEIGVLNRQKTTEALQLKSLTAQAEQLEGRRRQLAEAVAQIQERRDQLRAGLGKGDQEGAALRDELAELKAKLGEREAKRAELDQALAAVAAELSELRFEKHESGRDKKFADTLEQMKGLFAGVKGKLHELCRIPDKRYQTAVTVAMGKTMDAVVVDNAACAMECIQFLKEQRLPPITFIPLETIKATRVDERLRRLGGTCRPVVDCLQFEDVVGPAIRYAVGDTLVCDKMVEAKRVAFGEVDGERHKVVTVDGSCILKNGCIQGGQATMERKARKWDEQKYEAQKRKRDELVRELDRLGDVTALRNRELDLTSRQAALQASRDSVQADIAAADRKLETSNKELDAISKQVKELQPRVKEAEKKVVAVANRMQELESKKNEMERQVFEDFGKRVKIGDVQAYEERRDRLQAEAAAKDAELKELRARLENQLDFAERRAGTKTVKGAEKAVTDLTAKLAAEKSEQASTAKELEKVTKEAEAVRAEAEDCKKAMAKTDGRLKELKRALGDKLDALGTAKKRVTQRQGACQKLRSVRAATIQKCGVEEIALPMAPLPPKRKAAWEARRKRRKVDGGAAEGEEAEEEEEPMPEGGRLDYSEPFSLAEDVGSQRAAGGAAGDVVAIDFSDFDPKLKAMASNAKEYQKQSALFDDRLQRLELDLEKLAPNLKAMQRLADVEDKFDGTTRQFEECREEHRKAQAEFDAVAEKRYSKFMATFDVISDEIDKVYKILTRDDEFPAGGTAYISLDNPLEPYNGGTKYNAMPLTKRFREMEQLSGGEKTVAALALLFTVHRVRPSPFFILDEIDAALDHGNVVKVCNYVLSHCHTCQFLVISLKPEFFENASTLVGVYRDQKLKASRVLSWNLTQYDRAGEAEGEEG